MFLSSHFPFEQRIINEHHYCASGSLHCNGCPEVRMIHYVFHVDPEEEVGVQIESEFNHYLLLFCPARVFKVEQGVVDDDELVPDEQDDNDDDGVRVGLISEEEGEQIHQGGLRETCEEVLCHQGHSYGEVHLGPRDYCQIETLCEGCDEVERVLGTEACLDVCKWLHTE